MNVASVPFPGLTGEDLSGRVAAPPRPSSGGADLLASLALHGGLLALMLLVAIAPPLPVPEPPAIQTEVISQRDFDLLRGVTAAPAPAPAAEPELPPPAAPSAPLPRSGGARAQPDMVRPSRMLSEQALANPRSRGLRRALAGLAEEERIAQLCDLEAMEQIHAWRDEFQPDRLVDYALSDTRMEGQTLVAPRGAFRSRHQWYEVSFQCELDAGWRKVAGFAFHVGEPIPREEWAADNLAAVH
ncbi:DUF930 domain-containing protein [Ancylobacter mangrovi]|uniref:DUF930 domain-containing protein n=1 Tax=Ancylobacter mangrovi TaxID=2972472 RepID=UPI0021614B5B|nr:DUF930 domain-containing protein [Ancylobacter mangrovi]MCS0504184.1 DUF930 domain-containing protein [Ancylobacter mangrovi]